MRDFLLRLLGAPRQIVINIDKSAIAVARPGDVLMFTTSSKLTPEIKNQIIAAAQREAPDVLVCIGSREWAVHAHGSEAKREAVHD